MGGGWKGGRERLPSRGKLPSNLLAKQNPKKGRKGENYALLQAGKQGEAFFTKKPSGRRHRLVRPQWVADPQPNCPP